MSREEAAALASRGDFAAAAERYAELVRRHPDDVLLHYAYGSVLSHLDRRAEAREQFAWVVANGAPFQAEVTAAQRWLAEAARVGDAGAAAASPDAAAAATTDVVKPTVAAAQLKGQTYWPGVDPEVRRVKLLLRLRGQDEATKNVNIPIRIDLGRTYRVTGVPPGTYRLVGEAGDLVLWDRSVVLEKGAEVELDLGPGTSQVSPSDFPPPERG